jgi:hypothetical protein
MLDVLDDRGGERGEPLSKSLAEPVSNKPPSEEARVRAGEDDDGDEDEDEDEGAEEGDDETVGTDERTITRSTVSW